jgi:hypothetical protein
MLLLMSLSVVVGIIVSAKHDRLADEAKYVADAAES